MAIVIEGISKGPIKGHDAQLLLHGDGIVMEKLNGVYQTLGAEWKEIPDNHGRLIDADAIISKIERMVHPDDLTYTVAHGILKQIIEDAPTIVEATE